MSRLLALYLFAPRFIQPNPTSLFLTPLTSQQDKSFRNDQSNQRGSTLNKAELAEEIAGQTGLTKRTSREAVDAVTSVITDALATEKKSPSKPNRDIKIKYSERESLKIGRSLFFSRVRLESNLTLRCGMTSKS